MAAGVMWRLHFTGIAKTNEVYCGLEEHVHTEVCYAWVLKDAGEETAESGADGSEEQSGEENTSEEAVSNAETVSGEDQTALENTPQETAVSAESSSEGNRTAEENTPQETAGSAETASAGGQTTEENTPEATTGSEETASAGGQTTEENTPEATTGSEETASAGDQTASEHTLEETTGSEETSSAADQTTAEDTSKEASENTAESGADAVSEAVEEAADTETCSVLGVNMETGGELAETVPLAEAAQTEEWYLSHGYVLELVCGMEEHVHTVECLSDDTADVETASDWEATLPGLTGNRAFDVAAMARSQLGYTESVSNFILDEDGATRRGYTRYGAWYGNEYGSWDAMFAAFCLHYAGVDEEEFPVNSGAYAWAVQLKGLGAYGEADEYDPTAGDLVFFDTDSDEKIDRIGIVTAVDGPLETLTVIEGDYIADETDSVCENTYALADGAILGYGILPTSEEETDVADTAAVSEADQDTPDTGLDEDTDLEEGAETDIDGETDTDAETDIVEEILKIGEESSEALVFTAGDGGVSVTVIASKGALPENAVLAVSLFDESSSEYAAAAEAVGHDSEDEEGGMAALDITFYDELGMEIEPTEAVTVSVDISSILSDGVTADAIEVSHIIETDAGTEPAVTVDTVETIAETVTDDTDETAVVVFETESFSTFTLRWTYGSGRDQKTASITATTYLYGTNTTIGYGSANINAASGNTIDLTSSNTSLAVNGYTLVSASVTYNGTTYDDIVSIKVTISASSGGPTSYTYTYECTDSSGNTYTLYSASSTTSGISVSLYYTANGGSGGSTGTTIYVWYDRVTVSGTSLTGQNDSDGIASVTLDTSAVPHGDATSHDYRNSTTGLAIEDAYGDSEQTVSITVAPENGYYITFISINCCGSGAPTGCTTYADGEAYKSAFTVSTTGAITIDVALDSEKGFHHDSNSTGYFILIGVAPVPSPLYVEYDYGDIVSIIGTGDASSAFSTANGWTTVSSENANVYGDSYDDTNNDGDPGIKTANTQYKYAYSSSGLQTAADWVHYANAVTDAAKTQAAAAGYVFAGWKAEYYTSVTVSSQTAVVGGYQDAYNNWDYTFTTSYGDNTYNEGEQVALTTNVWLIAQWAPIGVTVEKEVTGLSGTDYSGTSRTYTIEIQKLDDSSGTEVWETYRTVSLSVTGDGTADETIYPLPVGTYRVVETGGNDNLTSNDGSTTYYIGVSTTGEVTISSTSYSSYTETTVGGTTVLLAGMMTVTNVYDDEPVVVDVILKKVDDNGNTLSDAVFTLTDSSGNTVTYTTGADGAVTMKELRVASSYTLTETEAPDGYSLISGDVPFTVNSASVTFNTTVDDDVIKTYVDSGGDIIIEVVNTVGAEMPSTGGGGTQMYTLAGLLLISGAACLLYRKRKANARGGGTSDHNL